MSWIDQIKHDLIIVTGDGTEYRPLWLNARRSTEYNTAQFNFPEVSGTLVDKKLPQGRKFPLELYFQGDDHLDQSTAFEKSSNDPRPWVITHPFYGRLTVQPLGLDIDNTGYNISKITTTVMETITEDYPKGNRVPQDVIELDVTNCNLQLASSGANTITVTPTGLGDAAKSINKTQSFLNKLNKLNTRFMKDLAKADSYFNAFKSAQAAVTALTTAPLAALQAAQEVIQAPANFEQDVQSRLALLTGAYDAVKESILGAGDAVLSGAEGLVDKILFQTIGGSVLTALCRAASTPQPADFINRVDAANAIQLLSTAYNQYLVDLDALQGLNGGNPLNFIPDAESMLQLSTVFNYTLSQLYIIAQAGKQQRTLITEDDSNWIILVHRLYALEVDDNTIQLLMNQNGAGLSTMLQVRKGTTIKYYI